MQSPITHDNDHDIYIYIYIYSKTSKTHKYSSQKPTVPLFGARVSLLIPRRFMTKLYISTLRKPEMMQAPSSIASQSPGGLMLLSLSGGETGKRSDRIRPDRRFRARPREACLTAPENGPWATNMACIEGSLLSYPWFCSYVSLVSSIKEMNRAYPLRHSCTVFFFGSQSISHLRDN
jgi:hypothetical protein